MSEVWPGDPGDEDRFEVLPELDIRVQREEHMTRTQRIEAVLETIPQEQNVQGYVDVKGKEGFRNPVRPYVGNGLTELARRIPLREGVELGTALGRSGLMFALGGVRELDTVEFDTEAANIARQNFKDAGVTNFHVHSTDSGEFTSEWDKPFDFVFIDHAKERYLEDFQNLEPLLSPKGVVLMDNTFNRAGECKDAVAYVSANYYTFMFTEPPTGQDGVTTGLLVGSKDLGTINEAFKALMDVRAS